jgi:hypothetical protein
MDVAADCEALGAFYRAKEGGKMVPWRSNDQLRMEFFNASFSGRREKGAAPCFRMIKEHVEQLLVHTRRSQVTSGLTGLTRCVRQPVGSVGPKGYLGWIRSAHDWEREILGLKENCGEEFGLLQFKLKKFKLWIKTRGN